MSNIKYIGNCAIDAFDRYKLKAVTITYGLLKFTINGRACLDVL